MLIHASIPADDPERVAHVLSELWRGRVAEFTHWPGGFVALAGDDRGTTIEVYPRERVAVPGEGEAPVSAGHDPMPPRYGCFHLAVATPLNEDEVIAIANREGWRAKKFSRGPFNVVEFWVENSVMLEFLTEEMQEQYRAIGKRPPKP